MSKVRVTLTFDTTDEVLHRSLGDDYRGRDAGITVESCAAALVEAHNAKDGYIDWEVAR